VLRPRSAALVLGISLIAWLMVTFLRAGLDGAAMARVLGDQFVQIGLPGVGAALLSQAAKAYDSRAQALSRGHAAPNLIASARTATGDCELALAAVFRERRNLPRARYHLALARDRSPEVATRAASELAYAEAESGPPGRAKAKRELLKLLVDHPDDPFPAYLVGRLFLDEGKAKEALHYLTQSLDVPGGDRYEAHLALAQTQLALGDRQAATDQAQKALALATAPAEKRHAATLLGRLGADHPDPWLIAAHTFVQRHWQGLLCALLIVLALISPALLHLVGRYVPLAAAPLYLLLRSTEPLAVGAYEAALRHWPDSVPLLAALARAYCKVGAGTQRATELYARLWQLRPGDTQALDQTVQLALRTGRDSDAALQACQAWSDVNRGDPRALAVASYLGRAYQARGARAPQSALSALQDALNAAPGDRELRRYLGALYSHYGQHASAIAALEPLLLADPGDVESRRDLAHALLGGGQAYAAYRHLRMLPPSGEVTTDLYLAGLAADPAGHPREALRILEEVLRRDPRLFDVEERVAAAAALVSEERYGVMCLRGALGACEAFVLQHAVHPQYGDVVLLVFRREFSDALGFPEAFAAHLPRLSRLTAGVAPILDFGVDEEAYYVVYRLPEGTQLSVLAEASGPMPPTRAAQVAIGLLDALAALHAAGEVHGDVQPAAVWTDGADRAVLVGAGMSLIAEAAQPAGAPPPRSPFHMAPEVVRSEGSGPPADLYAVGCVLYELLVGAPPLEGPTHLATLTAHVAVEPVPPSMRVPAVPEAMDHLVLTALVKDPADRFASAADFADALRGFLGLPARPHPQPGPPGELQPALPFPEPDPLPPSRSSPPQPPDPDRWWTFYDDTALLGSARFAKLYRGVHRLSGEPHAIKQLDAPPATGLATSESTAKAAEAVHRLFLNEMHLVQALSEEPEPVPGIVRLVQAYRADDIAPAYAMPLLAETLAARLARTGPLAEAAALALIRRIGRALEQLHRRGIVHRNLSPLSVMFAPDGEVCLGGLDRACRLVERDPMLLTEREIHASAASPSEAMGDIRFLSPEQCRSGEFDQRTDVYSLGCLLCYLLTGWAPFERPDPLQVMLDHLSTPPPRLAEWGVSISAVTQQALDRALAKSPDERFDTVDDMLAALPG